MSEDEKKVTLALSYNGSFLLEKKVLKVEYITPDSIGPDILKLEVNETNQTFAYINITSSDMCRIYWMIGLLGSPEPTNEELRLSGPPLHLET